MKPRGRYNQKEGNESRSSIAIMEERIEDNRLIEGPHIAVLKRMAQEKDWKAFQGYVDTKLKEFNRARQDSIVVCATQGIKF
jgi:hypothetical protein